MESAAFISQNKEQILDRWFDDTLKTYSADAKMLFKNQTDRFANPVGTNIREALSAVLDELAREMNTERLNKTLDKIIRMRAIQKFSPSEAVAFILKLKPILKNILEKDTKKGKSIGSTTAEIDKLVDSLMLVGFDVYMDCREDLNQIRLNEVNRLNSRLLRRAKIICDIEEDGEAVG